MGRHSSKNKPKSSGEKTSILTRAHEWLKTRNPIMKFIGMFVGLMVVFYVLTQLGFFKEVVMPSVITVNAILSNAILNVLGQGTSVDGSLIESDVFAVDIRRGCDALEPIAFFTFAVLSFPAPFRRKLPGMIAGVLGLFALNLVRIVSLYLIGLRSEAAFHFMHEDVWQVMFIFAAIIFWALWIFWAGSKPPSTQPAPA